MTDEEGFGPVVRGGPDRAVSTQAPAPPAPSEGFGPVQKGRRRRRWVRRLVLVAIVGLLVAILALGGTGAALLISTNSQIERIPVRGLTPLDGQMNVLLVGTDSRTGLTPEELLQLGTEAVDGERTDTVLLLSISGGRAAMLSLPRDLLVQRCNGTDGRINTAYGIGGPDCLVQTVTASTGIPLSHYVEVNFLGFIRVVDAVGGVSIWLDEPMIDRHAGVNLPAGCVQLDGKQALGFVRARRIDSDLGRIERQQRFLRELATEVLAPSNLVNIPRLFSVSSAAAQALRADDGLGVADLLRLGRGGRGLAGGGVASYTVPVAGRRVSGAAVLVPTEEAAALYGRFRDGSVLHEGDGTLRPADVEVTVLNGAGVQGLASRAADALRVLGFVVTGVGNAEHTDRTVILHPPGQEAQAALLAASVPGAVTEARSGATGITLVVGADGSFQDPPPGGEPTQEPTGEPGPEGEGLVVTPEEC